MAKPGAPRIARRDLPRRAYTWTEPRLLDKPRRRDVSNAGIGQSIIEKGIE